VFNELRQIVGFHSVTHLILTYTLPTPAGGGHAAVTGVRPFTATSRCGQTQSPRGFVEKPANC
jgi:hypothetical protein